MSHAKKVGKEVLIERKAAKLYHDITEEAYLKVLTEGAQQRDAWRQTAHDLLDELIALRAKHAPEAK